MSFLVQVRHHGAVGRGGDAGLGEYAFCIDLAGRLDDARQHQLCLLQDLSGENGSRLGF